MKIFYPANIAVFLPLTGISPMRNPTFQMKSHNSEVINVENYEGKSENELRSITLGLTAS